LRLDYRDFLRDRRLPEWPRNDPRRADLIARRPRTAEEVAEWARDVRKNWSGHGGQHGPGGRLRIKSALSTTSMYPEIVANGVLALIAVAKFLLDRQIASLEKAFLDHGGFTERLYRVRTAKRNHRHYDNP